MDSGVHNIDLLCWLVGEFPHKVYATGHATDPEYAECRDVDTCYVTLNFPSCVIGNFEISRATNVGYDQRLEVGFDQSHNYVYSWTSKGIWDGPGVSHIYPMNIPLSHVCVDQAALLTYK